MSRELERMRKQSMAKVEATQNIMGVLQRKWR